MFAPLISPVLNLGDYNSQPIISEQFNTFGAFGEPVTPTGLAAAVRRSSDSALDTGSVSLDIDADGVGVHHLDIDGTDSFYLDGRDYSAFLTAGTVDGISVVGTKLALFSIKNRTIAVFTGPSGAAGVDTDKLSCTAQSDGLSVYALIRRVDDSFVWNGAGFVPWANADIGDYDTPLVNQLGRLYIGQFPTSVAPMTRVWLIYCQQLGFAPSITDLVITKDIKLWNGIVLTGGASGISTTNVNNLFGAIPVEVTITETPVEVKVTKQDIDIEVTEEAVQIEDKQPIIEVTPEEPQINIEGCPELPSP